jgi:hypothetical protein
MLILLDIDVLALFSSLQHRKGASARVSGLAITRPQFPANINSRHTTVKTETRIGLVNGIGILIHPNARAFLCQSLLSVNAANAWLIVGERVRNRLGNPFQS